MTTMSALHDTIRKVTVPLEGRSYDILIGEGLLAHAASFIAPQLVAPRCIIVSDEAVWEHYGKTLKTALITHAIDSAEIVVPAGEASKSYRMLEHVLEAMLEKRIDRNTTIIALGGGVVGDLAGFAASVILRGVPFIQVPTTLLAQVDSSVGGKTAVNSTHGKNLVGSFYQPRLVLADISALKTLAPREMRAGYAEVIKYGLIADSAFYSWCLQNGKAMIAGNSACLAHAIEASCHMKAEIVGADERESAQRALLNLGHTFGHAFEAETHFSDALLHGEAVAIGMVMACRLSERLGYIGAATEKELTTHFKAIGLPSSPKDIRADWNIDALMGHMAADKKAEKNALNFIVLKQVGQGAVEKHVDADLVREIVAEFAG